MLARDVVPAGERRGHEVVALARAELDLTDPASVEEAVARVRPDAVINCAGFTDVDGAEEDERGAMRVNDEGAAVLAASATAVGAKVVYPSTDYVFDGTKDRPYVESDLPAPRSAYGRSKLGGETSVAVANERHLIVRTSWLFGVGGKSFLDTVLGMAADRSEILVVSDQVGCPTYTGHLAAGIVRLTEGDDYGIHHLAGGGACSWYELAQEAFDQAGIDCRVMAATTEMMARPAPRPAYSVLRSERPGAIELPDWRRGVAEFLAEREAGDAASGEDAPGEAGPGGGERATVEDLSP